MRRPTPVRRRKHAYSSEGRVWLAVVGALVIAAAGAFWGARAQLQASRSRSQVGALQAELTVLRGRVAGDERIAAGTRRHLSSLAARTGGVQRSLQRINWTLQSVPSESQLAGVRNAVAGYAACLPQLQREIDGLGLSWKINAAKPSRDSFRLFTSARVPSSCTRR